MSFDSVELGFVRILRDLDRDQIMSFLDSASAADAPANTVLTEQGDEDDAMVIILAGTLEVYLGHAPYEAIIRHAHRGETLGEFALLGLRVHRSASMSVGREITPDPPTGLWDRLATAVAGSGPRGRAPRVVDVLKV